MFLDISNLSYYQGTCLAFLISFVLFLFCTESQLKFLTAVLGWAVVCRVCQNCAHTGMIARGTLNVFHVILDNITALYLATDLACYLL